MRRTFILKPVLFLGLALFCFSTTSCSFTKPREAASWPSQPASPPLSSSDAELIRSLPYYAKNEASISAVEKLAKEGHVRAAVNLGLYYKLKEDLDKAVFWFRKAVALGDIESAQILGELFFPLGGSLDRFKAEVPPDIVTSYAWRSIALAGLKDMQKASGQGQSDGSDYISERVEVLEDEIETLEYLMFTSELYRADKIIAAWPKALPPESTIKFLAKSDEEIFYVNNLSEKEIASLRAKADKQDRDAMLKMLDVYWDGPEGMRDLAKAFAMEQELAALGDKDAPYQVARMYALGIGTPKNEEKGEGWLRAKASTGDANACLMLGYLSMLDKSRPYNPDEFTEETSDKEEIMRAVAWYEEAAKTGNATAMLRLYHIFDSRLEDKNKARFWAESAAEAGSEEALDTMVGVAESEGSLLEVGKWLAIAALRSKDPEKVYRARMMLAYVSNGSPEAMRECMKEAEDWDKRYPPALDSECL